MKSLAILVALGLVASACGSPPKPAVKRSVTWDRVASWSGRGNAQTESFIGEAGGFRLRWQTRNEMPAGAGAFKVTVHSAISGRPLVEAVDHKGAGSDITYVAEDPRTFYLVIDSSDLDWSVEVEEPAGP